MPQTQTTKQKFFHYALSFAGMGFGAFMAALAIRIFLIPNDLIDGGVVGISLILTRLYGSSYLSLFLLLLA